MVNDPIGDLIARIKNAAIRGRTKVTTPASKMRARLLDVLTDEGYIRGYHLVETPGAFPEFEIELKYFDGAPVIAEIKGVLSDTSARDANVGGEVLCRVY